MKKLEDLETTINKEEFIDLYCNQLLSIEKLSKYFHVCSSTISKLIAKYNLNRDKKAVKAKSNSIVKNKHFNQVKSNISKEDLYDYYIKEDNGYYKTLEHFGITDWTFNRLLDEYNIKKDRSKSFQKGLNTRIERYGIGNETNWKKGHQTRIVNYGSLEESYKQGYEKQLTTMLEKYGIGCSLLFNDNFKGSREHSKVNDKFAALLDRYGIQYRREFPLETKSYDFKVNDILIELNPYITHNVNFNPFNKDNKYEATIDKNYHIQKSKLAAKHNYRCIHVWDWDDQYKIIKLLLPRETIYARKCEIREVEFSDAKKFLNENHLQGYARCKIKLGLYYNDELVAIMTFSKPRYNKKYDYELIRYCAIKNIIGGVKKLFKSFIDLYNPTSIISYCDNSKFQGKIYDELNFNKLYDGTVTKHWYNGKNHFTDSFIRANGFSRVIHGCSAEEDNLETNNNNILMLREGYYEIYDCGQATYVWTKKED